jgi:hypothetical protein
MPHGGKHAFEDDATQDPPEQNALEKAAEAAKKWGSFFGTFASLPNTRTRLDHALTLRTGSGRAIGAVKTFSYSQSRSLDEEFEVNAQGSGMPVDLVPQNVTRREMRIERYDLYTKIMEEVFGTQELVVLTDQYRPFTLRELWRGPAGVLTGGQRIYHFTGCWFTDIGRTLDTSGDRVVMADATIAWTDRVRVL